MGAVRRNFTKEEKDILTAAGVGGTVQWRNVASWRDAKVTSGIKRDSNGTQYVDAIDAGKRTRTMSAGWPLQISSRHIRAVPAPEVPACDHSNGIDNCPAGHAFPGSRFGIRPGCDHSNGIDNCPALVLMNVPAGICPGGVHCGGH